MYFVLDYYYFYNSYESCLVVESDKYSTSDVAEICTALAFYFEEFIDDNGYSLSFECILEILEKYYGFINVKENVFENMFPYIDLPIDDVSEEFLFSKEGEECPSVVIDLFFAREVSCGDNWEYPIKKWILENKSLSNKDVEDISNILRERGKEE